MHRGHASATMSRRHEMDSAVRGFHIYKLIWTAVISEELPCEHEYYNGYDLNAVVIKKDGVVVGHLPRTNSATFWSFFAEQFYHL